MAGGRHLAHVAAFSVAPCWALPSDASTFAGRVEMLVRLNGLSATSFQDGSWASSRLVDLMLEQKEN